MTDAGGFDGELEAMAKVQEAVQGLEPAARARVLAWIVGKFGDSGSGTRGQGAALPRSPVVRSLEHFADLPALFAAASPTTDMEKVLVAAYWSQVSGGDDEVDARAVNRELANLGHRIGNVTRAFRNLGESRPALVIQTRKTGRSQQARKRYRVTVEGIRAVAQLLSGEGDARFEDEA